MSANKELVPMVGSFIRIDMEKSRTYFLECGFLDLPRNMCIFEVSSYHLKDYTGVNSVAFLKSVNGTNLQSKLGDLAYGFYINFRGPISWSYVESEEELALYILGNLSQV